MATQSDAEAEVQRVALAIADRVHGAELAALQGFPVRNADGTWLVLGGSQADQREHVGNAVPPPAAEAIAMQCRATLLAAAAGGFTLDNGEIWVRDPREGWTTWGNGLWTK